MQKLLVLTGAGMSAESGIQTFRGMGGLWERYDVMELASPMGWKRDPELVLRFYNERRKKLLEAKPNAGHLALVELEEYFDVQIITQNVDDLHERAGSTKVLHLHGELRKARSTVDESYVADIDGWQLKVGDKCPRGYQLRPHVVWFGEAVPMIEPAIQLMARADLCVVIGTSLVVYPAAGLLDALPRGTKIYLIDPERPATRQKFEHIKEKASKGVAVLKERLLAAD